MNSVGHGAKGIRQRGGSLRLLEIEKLEAKKSSRLKAEDSKGRSETHITILTI